MFHSGGKGINVRRQQLPCTAPGHTGSTLCLWVWNSWKSEFLQHVHGDYRHNQVPVLFWKDCSCRFYLKRRSFEREFFLSDCHKRFTPFRNDAPSNPFPFILLWLLVLWEERLDTDTRHTSLPVLLTQVTASSLFKLSRTKETAAQRAKGEGQGLVKLPSQGVAAWGSPPPFSAPQRCAHPPKVFQKKATEDMSLWNVERPGSVNRPPPPPRPRALGCMPPPRRQFTQARKWFLSSIWRPCSSPRPLLLTRVSNYWSPGEARLLCLGWGSSSEPISSEGNKEPLLTSPSLRLSQEFPLASSPPSRPLCLPGKNRSAGDAHTPPNFFFPTIDVDLQTTHFCVNDLTWFFYLFIYFIFSDTDLE